MSEVLPLAANRLVFLIGLAFLISAIASRGLAGFAGRMGLVDQPGGRKQHDAPVPVVGGIAMYMGFASAALASGLVIGPTVPLVVALGLLVLGGVADDLHDITPRNKLFVQILAALLMTSWAGVFVFELGDLLGLGPILLYNWAIPFSVVCAIGVINAVNMIDGLDGLGGGVCLIAVLWLAVAAHLQGLSTQFTLLVILAAAIAGFLAWNMRLPGRAHAKVFMGDAGSMMLGLALCWFSIDMTQGVGRPMPPIVAVWILAVPLLDMARVMFLRALRRADVFDAGREHLHHRLIHHGYSVPATVAILAGAGAVSGAVGIAAWRMDVPEAVMFYLFLAGVGALLGITYVRELRTRGTGDA